MQAPEAMKSWQAQSLIAAGVLFAFYGFGNGDWRYPAFVAPVLIAEIALRAVVSRRKTASPNAGPVAIETTNTADSATVRLMPQCTRPAKLNLSD